VSNPDQPLSWVWAIMMLETSTSTLSFRSSELSQLSEVFSSVLFLKGKQFMKRITSSLLMSCLGLFGTFAFAGSAREDTVDRLQKSVDVLQQSWQRRIKGIPEEVLNDAKSILVMPDLIKGGFIFGGKHGRGVASCRTANGWSAPAKILEQGTPA
jgi:hypothetical protein